MAISRFVVKDRKLAWKIPFLGLALLSELLIGCGKKGAGSSGTDSSELRIPILATNSLQSLDPIRSVELVQYNLDCQIFEGLVTVDRQGALVPALAARWETSEDLRTWTFFLRAARFADDSCFKNGKGRKVTANDVIYSWKRGLKPDQGSLNSWALSSVVLGADRFAQGDSTDIEGLEALDEQTIRIKLVSADSEFLKRLVVVSTSVVASEAVAKYGPDFGHHPVGSGPYKLKEWRDGQYVLLERNPNYGTGEGWQPKPATVASVRFSFFRTDAQVVAAFDREELDVRHVTGTDVARIKGVNPEAELEALHPKAVVFRPGSICTVHIFAPTIGPDAIFGSDASARRWLSQMYPRKALADRVLRGTGNAQSSVFPSEGMLLDVNLPPKPISAAIDDPPNLKGKTVKVAFVSSRIADQAIGLLKDLLEAQGASTRLFPSPSINALFSSIGQTQPDLTLIYWSPYFPDLANYLTALLTSSRPVPNFTGFTDPRLDSLADSLKSTPPKQRFHLAIQIRDILDEIMPWIPIYNETPLMLSNRRFKGIFMNPVSAMLLNEVELAAL